MTCLILGGSGFIGSSIIENFMKKGISIRVLERESTVRSRKFLKNEKIEWISGDFTNKKDLSKAMEGCSSILHLISTTVPRSSFENPIYDVETNLISSINLLDCMIQNNIKKIVFASSGGTVYGEPLYLPIDESHPNNPLVSYGITKLSIEKYILMYAKNYNLEPVILRIANPYGINQSLEKKQGLIGVFLKQYLNDEILNIWGNGSVIRDYIYIDDVAEAFFKAFVYTGEEKIFNIGSSVGLSIMQVISLFEKIFIRKARCRFEDTRFFDISSNILNCDLARKELNWHSTMSLEKFLEGIREKSVCFGSNK